MPPAARHHVLSLPLAANHYHGFAHTVSSIYGVLYNNTSTANAHGIEREVISMVISSTITQHQNQYRMRWLQLGLNAPNLRTLIGPP